MGAIISYLWWGGRDPDAVNPESGLSLRDINNVRRSWTKVSTDGIASGTELLVRYFVAYPDHKQYFATFKDLPIEDLRSNRQFQAHCLNIITSLSSIIDNLEQPDLAIVMGRKLGSSHSRRHIKELQFNDLKTILVQLFINDFHFDEATMQSWVRTVTFIYSSIFKELDKK